MHLLSLTLFGLFQLSIQLDVNITKFDNCFDASSADEWPIKLQEVHYEFNDNGFIKHIYGKYLVSTIDTRDKEVIITAYKCSHNDPSSCEDKVEHTVIDLHCEKFRNDASGIWFMVSNAMSGSTCGHETGLFNFDIPRVNPEYFEKYFNEEEKISRYRMNLLFHKKDEENQDRRACLDITFELFN